MWTQLAWLTAGYVLGRKANTWAKQFIEDNDLSHKVEAVNQVKAQLKNSILKAWEDRKSTRIFDLDAILKDIGLAGKEETFAKILKNVEDAMKEVDWQHEREEAKRRKENSYGRGGNFGEPGC